ncbi:MAG: S41 family peptidase [Saprospiraceae bacterium]|nr:S41 family peptidase [Saprospiraceae bacterium]
MRNTLKITMFVILASSGIAAVTTYQDKLFEISKNLEIFISVYKELNTNFVDELDPSTLMRTAIDAMTKSLDPYTNYISESQAESYWISEDEKYQGIGTRVALVDGRLRIIEPYKGGPALQAGLKAGDEITMIEGVPLKGKKLEEINAIMRGIPGTNLRLTVVPFGAELEKVVSVVRGEVNIPNVPYSGFVSDGIGYISLTVFTQNAADNIAKALSEMKEDNPGMQGVIIDLRQNGGGLLNEAVSICNLFLPSNEIIVTTKGKIKERDQSFKTKSQPLDAEIPVAVLIDKRSASASEIVSGVIQDVDRGVLIGQRSYGKGLVQNTKDLPYNARIKLTTSKYYIPSGRCIQGVEYENGEPKDIPDSQRSKFKTRNGRTVLDGGGVTPDILLPARQIHSVTQALLDQYMIFEYANQFCLGKDSIAAVGTFTFTEFDGFLAFLKKKNFHYESNAEKLLKQAREDLEKNQKVTYAAEIKQLELKMQANLEEELKEAKPQIIDEIEKEIVSRYYFQKGKVQQTLDDDPEVREAISVLKDMKRYKSILGVK